MLDGRCGTGGYHIRQCRSTGLKVLGRPAPDHIGSRGVHLLIRATEHDELLNKCSNSYKEKKKSVISINSNRSSETSEIRNDFFSDVLFFINNKYFQSIFKFTAKRSGEK